MFSVLRPEAAIARDTAALQQPASHLALPHQRTFWILDAKMTTKVRDDLPSDYLTVSCLPYLVAAEEPPGAYLGTFEIVGSLA